MSSSVQMFHQNAEEKSARKMQKWSGESKALFKEDGEDDPIAENGQKGLHLDRPDRWSWGWRCGSSRWSWRQSHGRSRHPGRTWPSRSCLPQGSSRPRTSPVEFPAPGPPPLRPPQPSEPSKNQASPVSLSLSLCYSVPEDGWIGKGKRYLGSILSTDLSELRLWGCSCTYVMWVEMVWGTKKKKKREEVERALKRLKRYRGKRKQNRTEQSTIRVGSDLWVQRRGTVQDPKTPCPARIKKEHGGIGRDVNQQSWRRRRFCLLLLEIKVIRVISRFDSGCVSNRI